MNKLNLSMITFQKKKLNMLFVFLLFFSLNLFASNDNYPESGKWAATKNSAFISKKMGRIETRLSCVHSTLWITLKPYHDIEGIDFGNGRIISFEGLSPSELTQSGSSQYARLGIMFQEKGGSLMGDSEFTFNDISAFKLTDGYWAVLIIKKNGLEKFISKLKNNKYSQIFFLFYGKDYEKFYSEPLKNPNFTTFSISLNGANESISKIQMLCK